MLTSPEGPFQVILLRKMGMWKRRCPECGWRTRERVIHLFRKVLEAGSFMVPKKEVFYEHLACHAVWCKNLSCIEDRIRRGDETIYEKSKSLLNREIIFGGNEPSLVEIAEAILDLRKNPSPTLKKPELARRSRMLNIRLVSNRAG